MEPKAIDRYTVAIHEAGHVVAELKFGINAVKSVTISSGVDYSGKMVVKLQKRVFKALEFGPLSAKDEQYFKQFLISSLAGPAAEARYLQQESYNEGAIKDLQGFYDIAYRIFSDEAVVEAYFNYIKEEARVFVSRKAHWNCIVAIADALMKADTLSVSRCREIIDNTLIPSSTASSSETTPAGTGATNP